MGNPGNCLLSTEDLKRWLNYKQEADVEKFLRQERIPYCYGKGGGPVTTLAAVDARLLGSKTTHEVTF